MELVRSIQHKGHEIRLFVSLVARDNSYICMYELHRRDEVKPRGVVAGDFRTAAIAEDAAIRSAMRWIDDQAS